MWDVAEADKEQFVGEYIVIRYYLPKSLTYVSKRALNCLQN